MIYLLSQMTLALAAAILLGVAIGWIIHGTSRRQHERSLKNAYARKSAQLVQAQSDIDMLNDDYNEMHRKTQEQIDALAAQNKQIPSLSSNLEKSQLLVRQMMQRHEAKVRDLTNENKRLTSRLADVEKQEQTRSQLTVGLENRQRQSRFEHDTPAREVARFAAAESTDDPFDQVMDLGSDLDLGDVVPMELDQTARQNVASAPAPHETGELMADHQRTDKHVDFTSDNPLSDNPLSDNSMPDNSTPDDPLSHDPLSDAPLSHAPMSHDLISDDLLSENNNSDSHTAVYINADARKAIHGGAQDQADDLTDTLDSVQALDDFDGLDASLTQDTLEEEIDEADLSQAFEFGALDNETFDIIDVSGDGSGDIGTLFEPVSQHDDLQQIFGIGPLTEKALNDLGITSYSQLADLKQHEIQRIADALQIGPGRIERDNWVGNARRQLEEVLEQL